MCTKITILYLINFAYKYINIYTFSRSYYMLKIIPNYTPIKSINITSDDITSRDIGHVVHNE